MKRLKKINSEQSQEIIDKVLEEVNHLLTKDEEHLHLARQKKPIGNMLPSTIIVTNRRIIHHKPTLFGLTFEDYRWGQLQDVHISEKLLGAELVFTFADNTVQITHLPKDAAKKIYQIAQEREEEWVGKRRQRNLDEMRAKSGAAMINVGTNDSAKEESKPDIKSKLRELKEFLEEGLITEEEYNSKKEVLLKDI
ncbi:hypothetical protein C0585_05970 [Candidatus Woesearchaeota archaeon]|nr:MAG: hypothetical protein C0585_05970 [Candidatus Woesearchaeota archaeon]